MFPLGSHEGKDVLNPFHRVIGISWFCIIYKALLIPVLPVVIR